MGTEKVFLAALIGGIASLLINLYLQSRNDRKQVEQNKYLEFRCPLCGEQFVWGSDFMADECGMDTSEGNFVVSYWKCSGCGAEVEVRDTGNKLKEK